MVSKFHMPPIHSTAVTAGTGCTANVEIMESFLLIANSKSFNMFDGEERRIFANIPYVTYVLNMDAHSSMRKSISVLLSN